MQYTVWGARCGQKKICIQLIQCLHYILNLYEIFLIKYLVIDDEDKPAASFGPPKNSMFLNNVKLFSFHINRKKKM